MVAIAALTARSVALAGFGLDSLIEIFASVVVVWELTGDGERPAATESAVPLLRSRVTAFRSYHTSNQAFIAQPPERARRVDHIRSALAGAWTTGQAGCARG